MTVHAFPHREASDAAQAGGLHGIDFATTAKQMQARIGAAMRRRRRAIEITLTELARVCDVSFQQVQKYESGACSISAAQLWTIACALGVPVSYFYEATQADA